MRLPIPPPGQRNPLFYFSANSCQRSPQSDQAPHRRPLHRARSPPRTRAVRASPAQPKPIVAALPRSREARRSRAGDIDPALLPSREAILAALQQCRRADAAGRARARARRRRRSRAKPSTAGSPRWSATASCSPTARASCASSPSSTSSSARCRGIPTASASSSPTTAATTTSSARAKCTRCCTATARSLRMSGIDRRGRPEGEIVEVLERANREVVGRLSRGARHLLHRRGEPAHQPGPPGPGRRTWAAPRPARSSSPRSSSSRRHNREAVARVKEVLGSATDPGIEIEIALRKHALPFEFSAGRGAAGQAPADRGAPGRSQGPRRPHRAAAGHHRRRDGEGFRRRRLLRAQGQELPADRRHRRRRRTTCATATRSTRRARARHVRVFPAARDPDAAGGAVQRAVLAEGRRSTACAWRATWKSRRTGAIKRVPVLSGGDAFARAPHLHAGVGRGCRRRQGGEGAEGEGAAAASRRTCTRCTRRFAAAREQARRDRLRHGRARDRVRRARQDHAHRARRRATTRTS